MNNYPVWWNQTVTIYNKFENPTTKVITWYRTEVTDCFWKDVGNKITVDNTTIETDSIICRIPKNEKFLDKYQWDSLSDTDKALHFTVGVGDIIVKGSVQDVVNEYVANSRSSDLLTKYRKLQGCMQVERCAINTGIGRGNEHYYVKGV